MQVSSSVYSSSQHYIPYHNIYHTPLIGPQDHDLKRQYLSLLPPQQIIEICLSFDLHVPPYIKSTIWPQDINAAIAGLRKLSLPTRDSSSKTTLDNDGAALMDSLTAFPPESSLIPPKEKGPVDEPRPPDKDSEERKPDPSNLLVPATTPANTDNARTVQTIPPAYPQQHYGYSYPHAPYYAPPPPGYPYPHPRYSSYLPTQTQMGYVPPHPQASIYPAIHGHARSDGQLADDMPSYEEMIVEALMDAGDPEGCAPKDLFTWMAARYPLQSNFRPSASQALQKAFKRGRLEKSGSNKYRLNGAWEGGSTSRRTTRRPQTHNLTPTSNNATSTSPFTHAPLVHHHHQTQTAATQQPYQPQPYGYPYSAPCYSSFLPQTQPQFSSSAPSSSDQKPTISTDSDPTDAYEAAQSILNAINFGTLLRLPAPETQEGLAAKESQAAVAESTTNTTTVTRLPSLGDPTAVTISSIDTRRSTRADLQAQLALLAAQLVELAQETPSEQMQLAVPAPPVPRHSPPAELFTQTYPPQPNPPEDYDSDDEDMEEVI